MIRLFALLAGTEVAVVVGLSMNNAPDHPACMAAIHWYERVHVLPAGTEVGVEAPSATFSACYAGAFLLW